MQSDEKSDCASAAQSLCGVAFIIPHFLFCFHFVTHAVGLSEKSIFFTGDFLHLYNFGR